MEELSEVITCAEFHPNNCSLFAFSTSKGVLKVSDLRQSALCDTSPFKCAFFADGFLILLVFVEQEDPANKSFFSEIIASISDIKFSPDGRYLASRDYMTLKVSLLVAS